VVLADTIAHQFLGGRNGNRLRDSLRCLPPFSRRSSTSHRDHLLRAATGGGEALGFSEVVYRIPSVLAVGLALFLIARLAARLIHPQAGWFAAFACLSLGGFNYEAADARPYGLGTAVFAASLLFLVRWFDRGRWIDALFFAAGAALLWRVHLIYWPFYAIFEAYAV
jgi:4-amino-4-deoxy-L-arabinose transferase-like glycosyltransferase